MNIEAQIRSYIVDNFLLGEGEAISDTQSLLESGVIDSTAVLEIVAFLEETFALEVADEDLVPDNLDTIQNISAFVQRKHAGLPKRKIATVQ